MKQGLLHKKQFLNNLWSKVWNGGFQLMLILVFLGMYFDAAVVFFKTFFTFIQIGSGHNVKESVFPCLFCSWMGMDLTLASQAGAVTVSSTCSLHSEGSFEFLHSRSLSARKCQLNKLLAGCTFLYRDLTCYILEGNWHVVVSE